MDGFIVKKIGENPDRLGILVCTHGDETLGYNAMKMIEDNVTDLTFILVNKKAFDQGKRYVEFDLNRCFLGNTLGEGLDSYEYNLSKELHKILSGFDNIIDVHSTNFDIEPYFIINDIEKKKLKMIKCVNKELINNIYLIPLSKGTLIGSYTNSVAIECGINDDKKRIEQVANILKDISDNMSSIQDYKKEIYSFGGDLTKQDVFRLKENIKDFQLIKKGSILGYDNIGNLIKASENMRLFWINNSFQNENIIAIKLNINDEEQKNPTFSGDILF